MECCWGASAPLLPAASSAVEELHLMKDMSFGGSLLGKRRGDRALGVVREIAVPNCKNFGAAMTVCSVDFDGNEKGLAIRDVLYPQMGFRGGFLYGWRFSIASVQ